ncbi:MAG: L,D-transpeptidase [Prolixibacteraceae bacterium]
MKKLGLEINKIVKLITSASTRLWNSSKNKMTKHNSTHHLKFGAIVIFLVLFAWMGPKSIQPLLISANQTHFWHFKTDSILLSKESEEMNKQIALLDNKLTAFVPKTPYLIINSTENKFTLYKKNVILREGRCSTGSYLQLERGENQKWLFKTPKGEFKILNKRTDPVWKKPDWAFIEEGLPVPSYNHSSRYEYGVLGDYALSLGDGYMIHGTIWQRYLGLPVTHGCVRLNDADLEVVYKALPIGSKVYIF